MRLKHLILPLALVACAEGNSESNPVCGISAMAGATMVLEQFSVPGKILDVIPAGMEGVVPARVVGYGTARALVAQGPDGIILGYEGEGFPTVPGYALALVEDSLDTFKGVLITTSSRRVPSRSWEPYPAPPPQYHCLDSESCGVR